MCDEVLQTRRLVAGPHDHNLHIVRGAVSQGIDFYEQFHVLVLGLDSVEARRYMNSVACSFLGAPCSTAEPMHLPLRVVPAQ